VRLTIRARLTLLYFGVLVGAFLVFVFICDYGFQRSIHTTVNEASRGNLESVRSVIDSALPSGMPAVQQELSKLSGFWANGAIFEVAAPNGEWLFRSPRFASPQFALPAARTDQITFVTTNLDWSQYRIAREAVKIAGRPFLIDAAVPTEPFDQALDSFRLIEKEFIPLLIVLASFLGYWLSGRALAPVNRIIATAESIGVQNLSQRLEVPRAKDELRRLTETVNAMLARIESSVNRITQFTADASHDLRTPLSLIRTNAELALRRPRSEMEYRETLSCILAASEETTELIEELLLLARADAGAAQLKYEDVDLRLILQKISREAQVLAASKGLLFSDQISSSPMLLRADAAAMERLFLAVIDNAVKYTGSGGQVFLRPYCEKESVVIEIEDTGIGIAEDDLDHIFDRFFRADQARSREVRGSGLGLSIAHWITEMHQGTIQVKSQVGQGSVFSIRLPQASASPTKLLTHENLPVLTASSSI
jgi:heavy metal sensor kinase